MACCKANMDIVRCLVKWTGVQLQLVRTRTVILHCMCMACKWDRVTAIQFLLSTGRVDPWCKNSNFRTLVQLTRSVIMNEPHKGKSSVREPHTDSVTMRVNLTDNTEQSQPNPIAIAQPYGTDYSSRHMVTIAKDTP